MTAPHKCSGLLSAFAICETCGWEAWSRNALGIAAQHASRTGHYVRAEQVIGVGFNCTTDHVARRAEVEANRAGS